MSLWKRLDVLVPNPKCRTFGEDYNKIEWLDARPQPTEAELQSVTQPQIDARDPELKRQAARTVLADRKPGTTPVTRDEFNSLLDVLGI